MLSKTKIAFVAATLIASASGVSAQSGGELWTGPYLRNPDAPVPTYQESTRQPMARLIERRNVSTVRTVREPGWLNERASMSERARAARGVYDPPETFSGK